MSTQYKSIEHFLCDIFLPSMWMSVEKYDLSLTPVPNTNTNEKQFTFITSNVFLCTWSPMSRTLCTPCSCPHSRRDPRGQSESKPVVNTFSLHSKFQISTRITFLSEALSYTSIVLLRSPTTMLSLSQTMLFTPSPHRRILIPVKMD